jgi:hypothetical protein
MNFGEKCTESIRAYLKANNLKSIGALNAEIIADLINRVYDHEEQTKQAEKDKKKALAKREKGSEQPPSNADRELLFHALANVCGMKVEEMTRKANDQCGLHLAQIIEVMPHVTVQEIWKRGKLYKQCYPSISMTPMALSLHWAKFGGTSTFVNEPTTEFMMKENDPYQEPKGDWRSLALNKWPEKEFPHLVYLKTVDWKDLTLTMKNILKAEFKK